ncbi:MAG: YlxM family DNA-binding protein [Dehalobacter sp. 4CP]|uniref:YlxM family DNA-binding protein n=1 Tax=Dehalobacter sp. CP TaxID=2594474 RepID=UPI0013CA5F9E|nr:YlxM family DNA-binding protein [Dehalobacter sp.]NBJ15647.1 YlxM family DNA-binding protein [Dehalobacter sp. 4CP]
MKEIAEKALLFDFYGPLLTEKQGKIWDLYYQQDYSLSEIAAEEGISRQAVYDLLKRTEKILEGYEHKLGLIFRFIQERDKFHRIESLLEEVKKEDFSSGSAWKRQLDINMRIKEIIADTLE